MQYQLLLLLGIPLVFAGFDSSESCESSSSSSSGSHEHYGGGRGHHHHGGHRPRPPPPRPAKKCDDGWTMFNRTKGPWCMKVFYAPGNQMAAENGCMAQGATLTGQQNAMERMWVANTGRILANAYGGGLSEVWIGARRKAQCPQKRSCGPNDTFEWTDGHTDGVEGFYWPGPEPNNARAPNYPQWGLQHCLQIQVSAVEGRASRFGYPHGSNDDDQCQRPLRMYACGKLAK